MNETLAILMVTSLACAMIGVFLVLRNLAMVSDAISHSVLLGIVLAYFITKDVTSPFLIIGAGIFGILTVFAIDMVMKTRLIREDAAVGIVFPLFFATAVILISKFARNVHIDTDMVLMGEVIFAPLNRIDFFGLDLPKALVQMSIMLILNLIFIVLFYKELKVTTFDQQFAYLAGFSLPFIYYSLMTLVSITSVAAFDSVGAILVISFLVTPAATAYLLTHELKKLFFLTAVIAMFNSWVGYKLSLIWNVSMSGMIATVAGIVFLLALLFNPTGMITRLFLRYKRRMQFERELLIMHLGNHIDEEDVEEELGLASIEVHLNWSAKQLDKHIRYLSEKKLVRMDEDHMIYRLTLRGMEENKVLREIYGLDIYDLKGKTTGTRGADA